MERQAVADLRTALTKAVCAVLELCQQQGQQHTPESCTATDSDGLSATRGRIAEGSVWGEGCPQGNVARGPPSALVQMVCSGEDASVRCAVSEYRLSTGMAMASRCATAVVYGNKTLGDNRAADGQRRILNATTNSNSGSNIMAGGGDGRETVQQPKLLSSPRPQQPPLKAAERGQSSRLKELSTTVAESGTMARNIISSLKGLLAPQPSPSPSTDLLSPAVLPPPTNPRDALLAARTASAGVRPFTNGIQVNVGTPNITDRMPPFGSCIRGGREGSNDKGGCSYWGAQTAAAPTNGEASIADNGKQPQVDTTASTRIVNALRGDILWAESLPAFVHKAMEAVEGNFGQQLALK